LDKLYNWALEERLISDLPFRYARARGRANQFAAAARRNRSYEAPSVERGGKGVSPDLYAKFREHGLSGRNLPGRAKSRHRNGARNVAFADLLVTSGLRLQEASALITFEWRFGPHRGVSSPNAFFRPGKSSTKGSKKRKTIIPSKVIRAIDDYVRIERSLAVAKGYERKIWEDMPDAIFIRERTVGQCEIKTEFGWRLTDRDSLTPDVRYRLVECSEDGEPLGFACLWLTEVGRPVDPNTWEVAFRRACARCHSVGIDVDITPHTLRHTFASYILPAIEKMFARLEAETGVPQGNPIRHLQHMLGHSSSETTALFYLPALGADELTVDQHIDAFFVAFTGSGDASR
jgi:integrase